MVGITFDSKKMKFIHIVITIVDFLALVFFLDKILMISYANVYQYGRITGIEHVPLYLSLSIVLFTAFIVFICFLLSWKKSNKKIFFAYAVFVILIIIAVIVGFKLPKINEYTSSSYNQSQAEYLPIDKFEYKENSEDYYFYREVTIGNTYWIGSSSYKDFAAENRTVEWTEEPSDSTVYLEYYYLLDESGCFIKDFSNRKVFWDIISPPDFDSEQIIDGYTVYEYFDSYEVIFESDSEVFYLCASKNKRTEYDANDLVSVANELTDKLRKNQKKKE